MGEFVRASFAGENMMKAGHSITVGEECSCLHSTLVHTLASLVVTDDSGDFAGDTRADFSFRVGATF